MSTVSGAGCSRPIVFLDGAVVCLVQTPSSLFPPRNACARGKRKIGDGESKQSSALRRLNRVPWPAKPPRDRQCRLRWAVYRAVRFTGLAETETGIDSNLDGQRRPAATWRARPAPPPGDRHFSGGTPDFAINAQRWTIHAENAGPNCASISAQHAGLAWRG